MINILGYFNASASAIYRGQQIFKYLNRTKEFSCVVSPTEVKDEQIMWADIVLVQGIIDPAAIAMFWAYKMERNKVIVVDRDDFLQVADDSPLRTLHKVTNTFAWSRELVKIATMVTVTTPRIKQEVEKYNKNVKILPNYLDMEMWDLPIVKNPSPTLRIGWTGSYTHRRDLDIIIPIVKKVIMRHDAKFIFCGDDYPIKFLKDIPRIKWEYVVGTREPFSYPTLAHTLALDIGLAPLVDDEFNRCKSNLRALEYGILKLASVYSPTAYNSTIDHGKNGFIAKTGEDWEKYIELLVTSKPTRDYIAGNLYKYVRSNYDIGRNYRKWGKLYKRLLNIS